MKRSRPSDLAEKNVQAEEDCMKRTDDRAQAEALLWELSKRDLDGMNERQERQYRRHVAAIW